METPKNIDLKQNLIKAHRKGTISLILLGLMTLLVVIIIIGRIWTASLVKELSIVVFNTQPNPQQDYSILSSFFTINTLFIIFIWLLIVLYFTAWWFRFKKIRFDALIVYTLIGFVLSSGLYLSLTQPMIGQITTLTQSQVCSVESQEVPYHCEFEYKPVETQLHELSENVNNIYFLTQTAFLGMVFFLVLSILQLLMDRVKKLIVFRKIHPIGEAHGKVTI